MVALGMLATLGVFSTVNESSSTASGVEPADEIQIVQAGASFRLTCDGTTAREGYHVALCYLTNAPAKNVVLDCKVTKSAKIVMGLKIEDLLDGVALADTSRIIRFDLFHSPSYGQYKLTGSELVCIDLKQMEHEQEIGK